MPSRPYRDATDFDAMQRLLIAGRQLAPQLGYVHVGDLNWWWYYNTTGTPSEQRAMLWEDDAGGLMAWAFLDFEHGGLDIFGHPRWRGQAVMGAMLTEALNRLGSPTPQVYAEETDVEVAAWLTAQGFTGEPLLVRFERRLDADLPTPTLPDGYRFLPHMNADSIAQRAAVHASAFDPSRMTPAYYADFRQAPAYDPALDVAVVAPNGMLVAFVMAWAEPTTRHALFEPVGTHYGYRRMGLGRATMLEAMRRLRGQGMVSVQVSAVADSARNRAFYASVGFRQVGTTLVYRRG